MNKTLPVLEAVIAVVVWGASFVATKVALADLHPNSIVWLRFAMGVVMLGVAVWLRGEFALPKSRDLAYLAGMGFMGITFHQWLQSTALLTTRATNSSWIVATIPIFMALIGWLTLGERLTLLQGVGIAVAGFGVLIVVTGGDLALLARGNFGTLGDFLTLISAVNWAVFSVLSRRGLRQFPAVLWTFYIMVFGWLFSNVLFFIGPGPADVLGVSRDGWLGVIFLGIFCSGLAYIFWFDALQKLSVAQTGSFIYLEPLVTVVVAAAILAEPFGWAPAFGGATILGGVWLVNR